MDELDYKKYVKPEYARLMKSSETPEAALRRLIDIVEILRVQCPWDRVQTHETLRKGMIEEAYETVDAINNADYDNLEEELGDVLLQVVFHASLAGEKGRFSMTEIADRECEKMIRRHPHVFGDEQAKTVDNVLEKWENIKRAEHGETTQLSRLESVPRALPALMRAYKLQARAAEVGFDWDNVNPAFDKIKEETEELLAAYGEDCADREHIAGELGDLLFSVVNAARFLGIDPELALTMTSDKFTERFGFVEKAAASSGRRLENMTLDEMDALWEEAKTLERE